MRSEDVYALTSVGDPRLSPDGRQVAYVVNWIDREENGYRSAIWVAPVDGSEEPRRLTFGKRADSSPRWSPDGGWLAFVSNRDGEDENAHGELYVLPANGGEPRRLSQADESAGSASFSPDGGLIAYHHAPEDGTNPHHGQVAVMRPDGRDRRVLTASLDRQCAPYPQLREPLWDGGSIAFAVEDGGNVHLYTVASDGLGEPELLVGGDQATGLYDLVDGVLVYTATTHTRPSELFAGNGRRMTSVCDDFVAGRELAEVERFAAASADGTEVDAWLVRPPGFDEGKRYPVLLTIHGGPFSQYGTGFFDEVQVYAGAGYCVLFSNPRGGSGCSEAWGREM